MNEASKTKTRRRDGWVRIDPQTSPPYWGRELDDGTRLAVRPPNGTVGWPWGHEIPANTTWVSNDGGVEPTSEAAKKAADAFADSGDRPSFPVLLCPCEDCDDLADELAGVA